MVVADPQHLTNSADTGQVPYKRNIFTNGILPAKLMEYACLGIPTIAAHTSTISIYFCFAE